MQNYELTLLCPATLNQEELQKALQSVILTLGDKGAIGMNQDMRGRRILPQGIKKQKEAYLISIKFMSDPNNAQAIQESIKANPSVLRSAFLTYTPRKMEEKIVVHSAVLSDAAQEPKVEIADIDKQLEELFGEKKKPEEKKEEKPTEPKIEEINTDI